MAEDSFDIYSNTDVNDTPFRTVIFGRSMPLLEAELNEMQEILYHNVKGIAAAYIGNRLAGDIVNNGSKIVCTGNVLISGYNLNIDGIQLDILLNTDYWFNIRECDLDKDSTVRKHGYVDGEQLDNTILDNRYGVETSRRKAIEFSITNEKDTDSNSSVKAFHVDADGNIVFDGITKCSTTNFKGSSEIEAGVTGLVPAPPAGDGDLILKSDGTWGYPTIFLATTGQKFSIAIRDGHVVVLYDE